MKTTLGNVRNGGEGGGQDDEQRDGESGSELHFGSFECWSRRVTLVYQSSAQVGSRRDVAARGESVVLIARYITGDLLKHIWCC